MMILMMMTMMRIQNTNKLLTGNWLGKGVVPGVTWGLNLKLGEAPAKGSVLNYENTSIRPLDFFLTINPKPGIII